MDELKKISALQKRVQDQTMLLYYAYKIIREYIDFCDDFHAVQGSKTWIHQYINEINKYK
jgi:hypothetical protein